jgi:DNA primase
VEVGEQALVSEMNKVLRRGYRKQLGGDAPVFEEHVDPAIATPQPEIEVLGTAPQERDLLRMLLTYGHERVIVPFQNEDGSSEDEEISVAELMFQSLAQDDITFDEPLFQAIYRDYSFAHKMGESVEASRYTMNADEQWRDLSIDLLTDRYMLSPNWLAKHKIHVTHEREQLLEAVEHGLNILKERRVDRMLREKQEQLKDLTDEADVEMALRTIVALNEAKKAFAKLTGRVVVG